MILRSLAPGRVAPASVATGRASQAPITAACHRLNEPPACDNTCRGPSKFLRSFRGLPQNFSQFALRRKVPLGDAMIVAAHKRYGSGLGQGEEFLRCFQITTVFAVGIDHDRPPQC